MRQTHIIDNINIKEECNLKTIKQLKCNVDSGHINQVGRIGDACENFV